LAETRNTNFFNSISNKFEKSKSGWLEEMGGPTGWQLATQRVHKITRERGNESVDELCVSPARSQTFFSFQINWNRRWKNQNQKMFFKLFFPERREELALVVSKVGGNSKTHFVVGRLSSSPLISCRQIWNWKRKIVSSSSSDGINNFFGKKFKGTEHYTCDGNRVVWPSGGRENAGLAGPFFFPPIIVRTDCTHYGVTTILCTRACADGRYFSLSFSLFFFQARRAIV
jgi:hypothetical protein